MNTNTESTTRLADIVARQRKSRLAERAFVLAVALVTTLTTLGITVGA
jgi:hypothetical protein